MTLWWRLVPEGRIAPINHPRLNFVRSPPWISRTENSYRSQKRRHNRSVTRRSLLVSCASHCYKVCSVFCLWRALEIAFTDFWDHLTTYKLAIWKDNVEKLLL